MVTPDTIQLPVLQIPFDQGRQQQTYTYDSVQIALQPALSEALRQQYNEDERSTFLLAVYFAWQCRLSGGETELTAGLRSSSGNGALEAMVLDLKSISTIAQLHQAVTEAMAAGLVPVTDQTVETLFGFNQLHAASAPQIVNWHVEEKEGQFSCHIQYDSSLLRAETMQRYSDYYITLLDAALQDTEQSFRAIDILKESDREKYAELNATDAAYDQRQTYHGMFEQAVTLYPDHKAIASSEKVYTYEALNEQANRLAHHLLSRGVVKGDFVTIFMDRSLETVISLLGIMKAGGVYVPLDPAHPYDRNSYIVEDTKSPFIVTKSAYREQALQLSGDIPTLRGVIALDELRADLPSHNPDLPIEADDLAYVIYTSGTTGKPKGTLLAHRGVVNLGEVVRTSCDIQPEDVLTQFATYSFDASIWDTIGALFYGAQLYLLSADERVSVEDFADAIERTGTTIITILPTVFFNQLAAHLSDEGFRKLEKVKLITIAGEALYGEQVRAFQRKVGDRMGIMNIYGPTEATVVTTLHRVDGLVPDSLVNIPIGKPIHNYKVYIVNEENQLAPVNVPGEVIIATPALSRGYLNQPERTAQVFVSNPFTEADSRAHGSVYKSGDIAKLLDDGTIEYVGRRDSQLKIRGHRIEIGEIEDNFAKIDGVKDAVVVAKKEADGQNMLVGYFTSVDGSAIASTDIKAELTDKLPSYFVPKYICQLDAMPISPTGKIDRKSLVSYPHEEQEPEGPWEAPQTETEKLIAAAWEQTLGRARVGLHDDFFRIGGDSLYIIHTLVILKPAFPGLKIGHFYEYRTLQELARFVDEAGAQEEQRTAVKPADGSYIDLNEHPVELVAGASLSTVRTPEKVLLTGATGYLGSHLLYELLQQPGLQVYALVRRTAEESGMERLRSTFIRYFGTDAARLMEGRVEAVEGDLEQEKLGLKQEQIDMLIGNVDSILHSAADVRHFGDSAQFARTNVAGTEFLLELASARPGVSFHHVSTLGIPEDLALSGQWDEVVELGYFPDDMHVENVYTDSKLEAEKILFKAAGQGVPVSIYRAGNLSSRSADGFFQHNIDSNAMYRMVKAMLLLGKAPAADWQMDFTPIDYAARAIVSLALNPDSSGRVFHICNPQPLAYSELIAYINQCGYAVETLPFSEYQQWLFDASIEKSQEGVQLAIAQLEGDGAKDFAYQYGCPVTKAMLQPAGVSCPPADLSFVRKMIQHAASIQYFPASTAVDQEAELMTP
ncbi:amino acid adenylation domain-containing protein [Paenibacillus sp. JX-17]|uniref:Amino acid adenylation domain-containing protein n=1 Tax=Paenibacillus lacisoli TaxID=3064525 RepID=A0ABT9CH61_9BACL|nr:non-ribosomal peptide synthetase [Paenibacillus sp. JX-17]MDO7906928.1 amino acid adenylation domain-containing protein [Paenibacillus sp. JX-17]